MANRQHAFFAPEGSAIHRLAHHPEDQSDRVLYGNVILVVLFQQALCCPVVGTNTRRLPTRVVPRGIAVVQLEVTVWVISCVK